jgi:AcrR family transcriptional regulator
MYSENVIGLRFYRYGKDGYMLRTKKDAPNKRDPEGVRQNILRVASQEFADKGLSGARIDEIAERTKTSKRMIYYYFDDKEGLYKKCLESAYKKVREGEEGLDLDELAPDKALSELVTFTFEHHRKNSDFIRMVMIENIHNAKHLKQSHPIQSMNTVAIEKLTKIIERGQREGIFRGDLDPVKLHWQISALSFFNVSNQQTFSALFGDSLFTNGGQEDLRTETAKMVLNYVLHRKETKND